MTQICWRCSAGPSSYSQDLAHLRTSATSSRLVSRAIRIESQLMPDDDSVYSLFRRPHTSRARFLLPRAALGKSSEPADFSVAISARRRPSTAGACMQQRPPAVTTPRLPSPPPSEVPTVHATAIVPNRCRWSVTATFVRRSGFSSRTTPSPRPASPARGPSVPRRRTGAPAAPRRLRLTDKKDPPARHDLRYSSSPWKSSAKCHSN